MKDLFTQRFNRKATLEERQYACRKAREIADIMYESGVGYARAREIAMEGRSLREFSVVMYLIQDNLRAAPSVSSIRSAANRLGEYQPPALPKKVLNLLHLS